MYKQYDKRMRRAWRRPKAEIHMNLLKTTLKNYQTVQTPGNDGIHSFWFKKFTPIQEILAQEMNRCLQRSHISEWMTKRKTMLIQKEPIKWKGPKQLQTHNLPTDDVEIIYYFLKSCRLFPDEKKGCCKRSRGTGELFTEISKS